MAFLHSQANSTKQPNVSPPAWPDSSWNVQGCLPWNAFQGSLVWHPLYTGVEVGLPGSYLPLSICPKQGRQAGWTTQQSWWALTRFQPLLSPGVPLSPAWTQHQPWGPVSYRAMSDLLAPPVHPLQLPQTQTLQPNQLPLAPVTLAASFPGPFSDTVGRGSGRGKGGQCPLSK